jgi:predicted PurR-regulated permease PerM
MSKKIEISHRTVVFTILFLIALWILYLVKQVIVEVFVALLFMAVLNPLITRLSRYKIPRAISILVVYLILFGVVSFTLVAVTPPLVDQTSAFITNLPEFMRNLGISAVLSDQIISQFISQIGTLPAKAAKLSLSLFSNMLSIISVLVFAFYFLSEREKLDGQLGIFFGDRKRQEFAKVIDFLETQLGSWARGQIVLMFIVGISNYIGLRLLGIPFALSLSILAGFLEIIPYAGPILAAIPAVIIGFGISPIIGIAVTSLAFLVQQLENYVFVPKIMQKSAGVNPVVTLLSLAIGFRLAGVVGLLISIPVFITIRVFTKEYLFSRG